jgi:putative salt-induced outer membrane protein YdiY
LSCVLTTLLVAGTARAQVNVETLRSDLQGAPAKATLEGSFTGRTGNVESVVAGVSGTGAARFRRHRLYASTSADYTRFSHETRVSKSFIHLRYNYEITAWLYGEAFIQQQHDKFQRLLVRELAGTGPRFVLADEEDIRLAVGTSYMFEFERIAVAPGAPDRAETISHRWNNYFSATVRPDDQVRGVATVYVQPRFDDFGDVRVLFETSIITDVTKRLGLRVIATVRHDTQPPTLVKRTDIEIKNGIVVKF